MKWRAALSAVRLELFVLGVTVLVVAFLRAQGLRMDGRTIGFVAAPMLDRWPSVLLLGCGLQLIARLLRRESPLAWLRGFVTPGSLVASGRAWLALAVTTYTYFWLKICVPLANRRLWDAELWSLDRIVHFGVSPSIFVVELFAGSPAVVWIDYWYALWLTTIFATQGFVLFDPVRRKRLHFAFACAVLWLTSAWIYVALPATGPCFFVPEVFDPVRVATPGAALMQESLWTNYLQMVAGRESGVLRQFRPFLAVAALPSVHVGAHFMFALWARRHAPRLWPVFALATALTYVGSLLTGWHYAVDAYLGMLLGWLAVRLADRWVPVNAASAPPVRGASENEAPPGPPPASA